MNPTDSLPFTPPYSDDLYRMTMISSLLDASPNRDLWSQLKGKKNGWWIGFWTNGLEAKVTNTWYVGVVGALRKVVSWKGTGKYRNA